MQCIDGRWDSYNRPSADAAASFSAIHDRPPFGESEMMRWVPLVWLVLRWEEWVD